MRRPPDVAFLEKLAPRRVLDSGWIGSGLCDFRIHLFGDYTVWTEEGPSMTWILLVILMVAAFLVQRKATLIARRGLVVGDSPWKLFFWVVAAQALLVGVIISAVLAFKYG